MATTRAALYARVSTDDQKPDLQVDELRELAQQRGWKVVGEFIDKAVSGSKDSRPELDRMLAQVHRGRVDVVVVWRFDRFARSVRHLVSALDDFRARQVDFVSSRDAIDTSTPAGRFTFHIFSAVAELERELIRERTKAGVAAARRRGKIVGRPKAQVDQGQVQQLRDAGLSVRAIAKEIGLSKSVIGRVLQGC